MNSQSKQIKLTGIQKIIAKRMLKSKTEKPCFYIKASADVTELMDARPKLRKSLKVKITTNAFYIRAIALAVNEYPLVTSIRIGDIVKIADTINIGFAVNAPQGLVVPVVKDADKKSLAQIAAEEKELTQKARSNRLTLEEIENETIALSNLGVYGIDSFIGIVPPPTSTIIAVGNVVHKIVPMDGQYLERKMLSLTLAADRFVIDEITAAKFLQLVTDYLQNPQKLI